MAIQKELISLFESGDQLSLGGYRGRFAPSSTGRLHIGNLRTALLSWLKARLNNGKWILRIDDIDTSRNRLLSIESIKLDLDWLGLYWDEQIIFQSKRLELYNLVLEYFKKQNKLYACSCSRRLLTESNISEETKHIYSGKCRDLKLPWVQNEGRLPSIRIKVNKSFSMICGDLILRRSDGFI